MKILLLTATLFASSPLWAAAPLNIATHFLDLRLVDAQLIGLDETGGAFSLSIKNAKISKAAYTLPEAKSRPDDILVDAPVIMGENNISRAWLGGPTSRYDHGVFARQVEASRLYALDGNNTLYRAELGSQFVFEDRIPRLVDIDADGEDELLVIRTDINRGAGIASYGVDGDRLSLEAQSETIGLSYRWLNIVGIEDFTGDGKREIAAVITPHIGGTLTLFQQRGSQFIPILEQFGFSNHQNGSLEQGMSAIYDFNGDGITDLAVPDANRQHLMLLSARGNQLKLLSTINNKVKIKSAIHLVDINDDGQVELVFLLVDGTLVMVDL
jgi:hypothetical protein